MATRRYLFGNPPFRFLADHLAQEADFLEDARRILRLDQDTFLRLAARLNKTDAFLSRSDLATVVGKALEEDGGSEQVASIIFRIAGYVHDADMDANAAMDVLGKAIEKNTEGLEPQERQTLIDRLRKLVAEPIGIAKQYKAQRLVGAIGAELDDFQIICDIRPIFDQEHERIEGAIPLTILRLEYSQADGEPAVVELRLTEKQITKFSERVADAHLKLRMIKDLLTDQHLPIPKTKSTIAEDKS